MRTRRTVVCGLPRSTLFFHITNGTVFGGKRVTEHEMCFDFLYNFFLTFLILTRNERDVIKKYIGLQVKYPIFLSDCN